MTAPHVVPFEDPDTYDFNALSWGNSANRGTVARGEVVVFKGLSAVPRGLLLINWS